jgi:hypothetical protein
LFPARTSISAQHGRGRDFTRFYVEAKGKGNFGNFDGLKRLNLRIFNGLYEIEKGNKQVITRLEDYPRGQSEAQKGKSFKISTLQKNYLCHYQKLPAQVIAQAQCFRGLKRCQTISLPKLPIPDTVSSQLEQEDA